MNPGVEALEPDPSGPGGPRASPLPRGERDVNPPGLSLRALLAEDFRTHGSRLAAPGFWALAVHRFGNWRMGLRPPFRAPFTLLYRTAYHAVILLWGIDLPYNARLGRRLRLCHHGSIHIAARSVGDDVIVRNAVTLGVPDRWRTGESPTIGDRVELGANAVVVGRVHVGDDSYVGPGTLVSCDVPAGTAVLGVPARPVDLDELTRAAS